MQARYFLLSILIICTLQTQAQQFRYGVKAGSTLSYFSGSGSNNMAAKVRYHAGALAEYKFDQTLGLQLEAIYNRQGATTTNPFFEADYKFDYLQIPLVVKVFATNRLAIEFGPQLGLNVVNKFNLFEKGFKDGLLNSPVFSGVLGLSYLANDNVFLQTRYNHSFTKMASDSQMKNSFVTLSVGYFIGNKKTAKKG